MATNDPNLYQYGGEGGENPQFYGDPIAPGAYKFSEAEVRTLEECNNESFYKRSAPLSALMGMGTFAAIQRGALKANPRFGAYPKVTLAVVVGYFIGKISYQETCAQKLMALPDSYIGAVLRQRRNPNLAPRPVQPSPPMLGARPDDIYTDAGPGNSLDMDVDRPLFSDDSYRPTEVEGAGGASGEEMSRPVMSYDELRRLNRGQYSAARQDPYRVEPSSVPTVTRQPQPAAPRASTNKYGDMMD